MTADMKVDWDELKQRHAEAKANKQMADEIFFLLMIDTFHAILAEREAAQAILEEIALLSDHQIPSYAFGDNEAACDLAVRMDSICKLANFDKKTQNEG